MKFSLRHDRCCVGELQHGEAKRVPRNQKENLMGYYLACPKCRRPLVIPTQALNASDGREWLEEQIAGELLVTMAPPITCDRCQVCFSIVKDEIRIH